MRQSGREALGSSRYHQQGDLPDQFAQGRAHFAELNGNFIQGIGTRHQPDQQVSPDEILLPVPEPLANQALGPVAIHRPAQESLRDNHRHSCDGQAIALDADRKPPGPTPVGAAKQDFDVAPAETLSAAKICRYNRFDTRGRAWLQTPSRARPLARRARITARPPRVLMRTRKPWVLLRRTTEGWKVRFMMTLILDFSRENDPTLDAIHIDLSIA